MVSEYIIKIVKYIFGSNSYYDNTNEIDNDSIDKNSNLADELGLEGNEDAVE